MRYIYIGIFLYFCEELFLMIYKNRSFYPKWPLRGQAGEHQICKIYGYSTTLGELDEFFGDSVYAMNFNDERMPFQFGDGLLRSNITGKYLDLYGQEVLRQTGYVQYEEIPKDNAQGPYYECTMNIDPDSDDLERWLQEVNSHQRPTLFVVVFSSGVGRVIGNRNGGMIYQSKFSAGGRKSSQSRSITYKWDSHHPSFILDTTDTFLSDGYVKVQSYDGHYFSSLATCASYFSNKFSSAPFAFRAGSNTNEFYFRVSPGTRITSAIYATGNHPFVFDDASGNITSLEANSSFIGDSSTPRVTIARFKKIELRANSCFFFNETFTADQLVIPEGVTAHSSFWGNHDTILIKDLSVKGTLGNSLNGFNSLMITDFKVDKTGSLVDSLIKIVGVTSGDSLLIFSHLYLLGSIARCFNEISIRVYKNLYFHHQLSNYESIIDSFNYNTKLWANEVELLGRNMTNSFQYNTDVQIKSIITCNVDSTGIGSVITGYFDHTTNLTIKRQIGPSYSDDYVSGNGFNQCSGTLRFKTGYDTINLGGVEGDVSNIIAVAIGTPTIQYNQ